MNLHEAIRHLSDEALAAIFDHDSVQTILDLASMRAGMMGDLDSTDRFGPYTALAAGVEVEQHRDFDVREYSDAEDNFDDEDVAPKAARLHARILITWDELRSGDLV